MTDQVAQVNTKKLLNMVNIVRRFRDAADDPHSELSVQIVVFGLTFVGDRIQDVLPDVIAGHRQELKSRLQEANMLQVDGAQVFFD